LWAKQGFVHQAVHGLVPWSRLRDIHALERPDFGAGFESFLRFLEF
jgi:hypothetical protein